MICPACGSKRSRVLQSRPTEIDGEEFIRRRRQCSKCSHRFTTYEGYDTPDPENTIRISEARKLTRRLQETLSA